jgi:L-ascorbate metabolism protein UlaG (beta-lactamase superfamily)
MKMLGEINKPTIGFMHVSLPMEEGVALPHPETYKRGEVTPEEALIASEWLGLKHVVASHYVKSDSPDIQEFLDLVEENRKKGKYAPQVIVPELGEIFTVG